MGTEPMFTIEYNRLDGQRQIVATCARGVPWTMEQLGTRRAIIHSVDPAENDCKHCLEGHLGGVTIILDTIRTGDSSG